MSLVHESLIDVLNRRFVSCHYNAFSGAGSDAAAARFCQGKQIRYGGILTPEGELLVAFGYDRREFYQAIKKVLGSGSKYVRLTKDEEAVFARARREPQSVEAQQAAARLYGELLQFEKAQKCLDLAQAAAKEESLKSAIAYCKLHYQLLAAELEVRTVRNQATIADRETIQKELTALQGLPADLEDDRALDVVRLNVELTPARGFYTGWRMRPDADLKQAAKVLQDWMVRAPQSNRIGQMHFYLGLVYAAYDDLEQADGIWRQHFEKFPDDRFAMLSRLHHTSYQFSPYKVGNKSVVTGK